MTHEAIDCAVAAASEVRVTSTTSATPSTLNTATGRKSMAELTKNIRIPAKPARTCRWSASGTMAAAVMMTSQARAGVRKMSCEIHGAASMLRTVARSARASV